MKKKIVSLFIVCVMTMAGISAAGLAVNPDYVSPHEEVDGGRAAENMPDVFRIENLPGYRLVASDDFNDNAGGSDTLDLKSTMDGTYNKVFENGTVKVTEAGSSFVMVYDGEILEGGYYAFRCRIKTEDVTAAPGNRLTAYNSDTDWSGEHWMTSAAGNYGRYKEVTGTKDWYEMTQLLLVPNGTKSLQLSAYYNEDGDLADTGTVYFDDFELYHVAVDPMEVVLVKPNYKGLIYGDGDADINLDVQVKESEGFFSYSDMALSVKLIDENDNVYKRAQAKTVSGHINFVFSSKGLPEGDYYLQTELLNKTSDTVISKKELTIRKRASNYRPENYVDENGYFIRNNERTILKRLYSGDNIDVAANVAKNAGIDNIAAYGYWWADKDSAMNFSGKAETLRELGVRSHIQLKDVWYGTQRGLAGGTMVKSVSDALPLLYKVTDDYKNDAILGGYNMFDEANPIISGEEIAWGNEILAQADIDHPTYGVANRYWEHYGIYTKMTDILTIDPYPVTGGDNDDIAEAGRGVRQIKENFPNRPIGIALQGFHYLSRGDSRSPNRNELLNIMWQAVCEGATVIEWYSYDQMTQDTTKDTETWISDLNAVYDELTQYEDIILSSEPIPVYSVTGGGDWLNIMLKRYEGKTYIFAVNNTKEAKKASVVVSGAGNYDLSFDALEVKKVEISQDDFLSCEAELKGLGFYNGEVVFAVAEGSENILYVKEDSGVINYCADISDGAKLYFGSEEMPEKGKITVRLAEEFTVTVVAEDGVTKTTKDYTIVKQ